MSPVWNPITHKVNEKIRIRMQFLSSSSFSCVKFFCECFRNAKKKRKMKKRSSADEKPSEQQHGKFSGAKFIIIFHIWFDLFLALFCLLYLSLCMKFNHFQVANYFPSQTKQTFYEIQSDFRCENEIVHLYQSESPRIAQNEIKN